jgi:flagellar basal body-associated protein FliL
MLLPPQRRGAGASRARSGKALIVAAMALVLAGGGYVAFRQFRTPPAPTRAAEPVVVVDPGIVQLEPFVINLSDPTGDRYFRLNLRLVLDQKHIALRAGEGGAQIKLRDRILTLLAKKRARDLTDIEGKDALRAEIAAATEKLFATPPLHDPVLDPAPAKVIDVLFTEFLIQ